MARAKAARARRYQRTQRKKKALARMPEWVQDGYVCDESEPPTPVPWTYVRTGSFPFLRLPAEIRNLVYDFLVPFNHPHDLWELMLPECPLTVPINNGLLAPRLVNRQISYELLGRLYSRGVVFRLNLVPKNTSAENPPFTLMWETSQTRMNVRGTCPRGTHEFIAEMAGASFAPVYVPFENGIPSLYVEIAKTTTVRIFFKSCGSIWRCGACKGYRFERDGEGATLFSIRYVLRLLCEAWQNVLRQTGSALENCPQDSKDKGAVVQVEIVQEGNWLGIGGRRFLRKGEKRDVWIVHGEDVKIDYSKTLKMKNAYWEDAPKFTNLEERNQTAKRRKGEAETSAERWLQKHYPEVRMRIRIITISNPGDDEGGVDEL